MRVLYFTKYSRNGASSRLRSFQYFPLLEENNIHVTVKPLFGDAYLKDLYNGKKDKIKIVLAYLKRFFQLSTVYRYDKVVIEKELFPYFFSWFERILSFFGVKYIVDYDDAIFHNYDLSGNKWIKKFLSNKIDKVMKYSDTVIAGNSYLATRAKKAGAKRIEIIPTVIDMNRYHSKNTNQNKEVVIGWIGSPSTFKYLLPIKDVFEKLAQKYPIKIHIVGSKDTLGIKNKEENISWTENTEVESILNFDIGIMPLSETPWELGKCSYKLIQYMGCGIPVVASPVGMNKEVVTAENGFLANSNQEWYSSLEKLILSHQLRKELGDNGRKMILENYSLKSKTDKLVSIITYGK